MPSEQSVLYAQIMLAKYFTECSGAEWQPVKNIMDWIKWSGAGLHRAEIKEARKRLEIRSMAFENGYRWKWENEVCPKEMWTLKSQEAWGISNDERKGY